MTEQDLKTEEKILEAAMTVFIQKGKAAARMQEIADTAGINKALLHYYYRSKDKLYESVFSIVIKQLLLPKIFKILQEEEDVFALIHQFADFYVGVINKNPFIPLFVIEEINKNPNRLSNAVLNSGIPIEQVIARFQKAMDEGKIRKTDPRQILVNLISMCIFPVAARNMLLPILFNNSKTEYKKFLELRKTEVAEFIIQSIKI
ncbi:MAG: TetR/AcrR family transcriptional regulator [Bacteroidales bacterium]|nr:TetR/AcrR family transcriptional regulator [Bacteroidales bacterium]